MLRAALCVIALLAAACETIPEPIPTPRPTSLMVTPWGTATPLTWATSIDPPALTTDGASTILGAFELHDGQPTLVIYRDNQRMRSNVEARRPHALTLFPAPLHGLLAFWLDDDGSGLQALYGARLNDAAFSERGPISISAGTATRYGAAPMPDGGAWAVWSVPNAGESTLIASRIDSEGRPRARQPLRVDADYPALTVTNAGNALLFWLEGPRSDLYRGELTDSGLTQVSEMAAAPWPRRSGDQLVRMDAGIDATHAYVFWQVRGEDGSNAVWYSTGSLVDRRMSPAAHLRIQTAAETRQTGFNHGTAYAVGQHQNGEAATAALPARGQYETLPAAIAFGQVAGAVYFKDGAPVANQQLGVFPQPLIAAPVIAVDDQRDLHYAWWMPDTTTDAVLFVISSRR